MKNLIKIGLLFAGLAFYIPWAKTQITPQAQKFEVADLKRYGLIIWLPDEKRRIAQLKLQGNHRAAQKEQAKVDKKNQELVRFFKDHFNFCKVYFYYTSLEEDLKNGLPVLLNAELKPDVALPLPEKIIIGGYYIREDQAHNPFPKRQFWVENSDISMRLPSEAWRPFWLKKRSRKQDIIQLNKMLHQMAGK